MDINPPVETTVTPAMLPGTNPPAAIEAQLALPNELMMIPPAAVGPEVFTVPSETAPFELISTR